MKIHHIAFSMILTGLTLSSAYAADKGQILVLLSSETTMQLQDGKTTEVGYYLNEFGVPAEKLAQAGYKLVLATPKGNAPQVDKNSVSAKFFANNEAEMQRIQKFIADLPDIKDTLSLQEVLDQGLDKYQAVFIPGGHAPLIDLANNPQVGQILKHFHAKQKPTAAICHGPITLLAAQDQPQKYQQGWVSNQPVKAQNWIYNGYKMTIFSDPEEAVYESSLNGAKLSYYPAKAMAYAGGDMKFNTAWQPHVVVDRELITGQNPFSDHALAKALLEKLDQK